MDFVSIRIITGEAACLTGFCGKPPEFPKERKTSQELRCQAATED
jgi:hypothetical protein